jgi:putative colanic acid biosynthesis acetyltransferase WcaF
VLWPWKLTVGENTWIGEDAWILNLEPVTIGHDVCISQGVFVCAGSHDMTSATFEYDNGPIAIGDEVWVGAQAMILRGVTVGRCCRGCSMQSKQGPARWCAADQ